jgi:hypothetical protein
MTKKRRPPGRPVGEFGQRGSVMGIRMPEDLRRRLQLAAQESGRSLSGELLYRVELTFKGRERGEPLGKVVALWEVLDVVRQLAYVKGKTKGRK